MRNWIIPTLCLLLAATVGYFTGKSTSYRDSADDSLSITPYDVLWGTDTKLWKLGLTDAGPYYGISLIHINNEGKETEFGRIGDTEITDPKTKEIAVLVSLKRDGNLLSGRYGYYGANVTFKDREVFQAKSQNWKNNPVLNGDLYYLVSDSETSGPGKEPFAPNSNRIALKLHRKPFP